MSDDKKLKNLKKLAQLMDSKFEGPFGIRFGLDGLLGFIPGIGDVITSAISFYIIFQAGMLGCSPYVLIRMLGIIVLENIFDLLPGAGNFIDIFWKANNQNVALIEEHLAHPDFVKRKSLTILIVAGIIILSVLTLSVYLTLILIKTVFNFFLVLVER